MYLPAIEFLLFLLVARCDEVTIEASVDHTPLVYRTGTAEYHIIESETLNAGDALYWCKKHIREDATLATPQTEHEWKVFLH